MKSFALIGMILLQSQISTCQEFVFDDYGIDEGIHSIDSGPVDVDIDIDTAIDVAVSTGIECECNGSILYDSLLGKNIGECLTEDHLSSTYEPSFFCFVNPQVQCNDKKHWKNGAFISYRACNAKLDTQIFVPKTQVKDENEN